MKQLSYKEVLALEVGEKVIYLDEKGVERVAEVFEKDEKEEVGKLRYLTNVTHQESGKKLYSYVNVWKSKDTGIYIKKYEG